MKFISTVKVIATLCVLSFIFVPPLFRLHESWHLAYSC